MTTRARKRKTLGKEASLQCSRDLRRGGGGHDRYERHATSAERLGRGGGCTTKKSGSEGRRGTLYRRPKKKGKNDFLRGALPVGSAKSAIKSISIKKKEKEKQHLLALAEGPFCKRGGLSRKGKKSQ